MGKQSRSNKAKKKLEKEEAKKIAEAQAEEDETEFQRVVLEIRVKELESLNSGLKKKCEYLESQNNVYKQQLDDTREEKEDLVNHLQRTWTEEKTNVKELEDRLYGVTQARADETKDYERRLSEKDKQFREMEAKLEKTILELGVKLSALEDFRIEKENLYEQKEELKSKLENERKAFQEQFEELENKMIRYRDKLKRDSADMIIKMAKDVQKAGKLCLTSTVKSAISANVTLQSDLETVSNDNILLRKELENIERQFRESRMTIQVLEEENEIVHRKCVEHGEMAQDLLERQIEMEKQLETVTDLRQELAKVKLEHAKCLAMSDKAASGQELVTPFQFELLPSAEFGKADEARLPKSDYKRYRDIIVNLAIAAKDMSQAINHDEREYTKERLQIMLIKLYRAACEIPDLPVEVKRRLFVPAPKASKYVEFH